MSKPLLFTGAGVALITPMRPDGSIHYDRYRELIDYQINHGTDAIIAVGTTGEASTLDDSEHLEALRVAIEHTAGRVPVIAGTGSNNTAHAVYMSREAKAMGADGLLVVTPYYNKTSQRGLIAHYSHLADAVDLPMIVYNVPSRTGVNIQPATVAELWKIPQVAGIKQANPNISETAQIAALCDIPIYCGNDDQIVPVLSLGGKGVISVLSHLVPQEVHDLCAAWFDGKTDESRRMQLQLLELANVLFCDVSPIPVKAAMNLMGLDVGNCRLPLIAPDEEKLATLRAVLRRYGLLE